MHHSWSPLIMSFCCLYTLLAQLYFADSTLTDQMEVFTTKLS